MKKAICIFILITVSISLAGCWSSEEPNDLAIVNSVVYDINEQGECLLTFQIINPTAFGTTQAGGAGGDIRAGLTLHGKGATFSEAVGSVSNTIDRRIFGEHNKIRFLTERVASNEYALRSLLEFLIRDTLTDESALLVVIKTEDKDKIYGPTMLGLSPLVGNYIEKLVTNQKKSTGKGVEVTTLQFLQNCLTVGKHPVAGVVRLAEVENNPALNSGSNIDDIKYAVYFEGLAMFKGAKFIGYLDGKETEVYNILNNEARIMDLTIEKDGDKAAIDELKPKAQIKMSKKGEEITADIKVEGQVRLSKMYVNGINEDNYYDKIKEIGKDAEEIMKKRTEDTIKRTQEEGSDIFGFGSYMHMQNPKEWEKMSDNWDELYKNMKVNVEYKFIVTREGEVNRPFSKRG